MVVRKKRASSPDVTGRSSAPRRLEVAEEAAGSATGVDL